MFLNNKRSAIGFYRIYAEKTVDKSVFSIYSTMQSLFF